MDTKQQEKTLTPVQLEKAVRTLIDIENMDAGPLYRKVRRAIDARRARRRRMVALRACAAVLLPACIAAGAWFMLRDGGTSHPQTREVSLTLPDGRTVDLGARSAGEVIADYDAALPAREDGRAGEEKDAAAASHTLDVPAGKRYDFVLGDGTHVWLNSESRITFPVVFGPGERRVGVEGEVFLEVAHQAGRPFVVEAGGRTVTVLGTSFNVYSYPGERYAFVTLVEGSVRVGAARQEVILAPGEQAVCDAAGGVSVRPADLSGALAWRRGVIDMEKQTLAQIAATLSRLYGVRFEFRDPQAAGICYRGNANRVDDIDEILNNLSEAGPVRFDRRGEVIEVRMK